MLSCDLCQREQFQGRPKRWFTVDVLNQHPDGFPGAPCSADEAPWELGNGVPPDTFPSFLSTSRHSCCHGTQPPESQKQGAKRAQPF